MSRRFDTTEHYRGFVIHVKTLPDRIVWHTEDTSKLQKYGSGIAADVANLTPSQAFKTALLLQSQWQRTIDRIEERPPRIEDGTLYPMIHRLAGGDV